eukprot:Hpha_TRINITY_DN15076_c5_g6::TRINITY_DN15076_c5_g6_i1::g.124939::m.124939
MRLRDGLVSAGSGVTLPTPHRGLAAARVQHSAASGSTTMSSAQNEASVGPAATPRLPLLRPHRIQGSAKSSALTSMGASSGAAAEKPRLLCQLEAYVESELIALGIEERLAGRLAGTAGVVPGEENSSAGPLSWERVMVWDSCLRQLGRHLRPYSGLIERALREFRWFLRKESDAEGGALSERVARELQREFERKQDSLAEAAGRREQAARGEVEALRQEVALCKQLLEVRDKEKQESHARWLDDHRRALAMAEALAARHEEHTDSKLRLQELEARIVTAEQEQQLLRVAETELETHRSMLQRERVRRQSLEEEKEACLVRLSTLEESMQQMQSDLALSQARVQQLQGDRSRQLVRTEQLAQELKQVREMPDLSRDAPSLLTPRPHWDAPHVVDTLWRELTTKRSLAGGGHRTVTRSIGGGAAEPTTPSVKPALDLAPADLAKRQRLVDELKTKPSAENVDALVAVVSRQRQAISQLHQQLHLSQRLSEYLRHDPLPDDDDQPLPTLVRRPAQFIPVLGSGTESPRYLRLAAKVPCRNWPVKQVRTWIRDFWAAKRAAEERRGGRKEGFSDFLYKYLGGEPQHQGAAEVAYNVVDSAQRGATEGDVDCRLFLALHNRTLSDSVLEQQYELVRALRLWFSRCEALDARSDKRPGCVSKRIVYRELRTFFSAKAPDSLLQLKCALHVQQPARSIEVEALFNEGEDSAQGFVSLCRRQHLDEVEGQIQDIYRLLVDLSDDDTTVQPGPLLDALQDHWGRSEGSRILESGVGRKRESIRSGEDGDSKGQGIDITNFVARLRVQYAGVNPVRKVPHRRSVAGSSPLSPNSAGPPGGSTTGDDSAEVETLLRRVNSDA